MAPFYLVLHLSFMTYGQNVAYSTTSIPMESSAACESAKKNWLTGHASNKWDNVPESKAECIPTGSV